MLDGVTLFGNVYEGRRVLVTGHTGFKGSWLALWLDAMGASVVGYALDPPTLPNLFEPLGLAGRITHVHGDVRDSDSLKSVFRRHEPEIVFHLAAQPLVRFGYIEPVLTYETNVMGTVNLLEAVRETPGVKAVINVTSDKCYENREQDYAYLETDPMGGFDPYSSSKGCSELVTAAYRNSFLRGNNVQLASARAGNVVGGGDWADDRIIPDCIRALSAGERIAVRNPQAIRPWQHVLEPLAGYLWLASRMWQGDAGFDGAWNFGPDAAKQIPVSEIVDTVIREWGSGSWYKPETADAAPHEAGLLNLDCTKAADLLGWHPLYDMDATLRATTAWYKAASQGGDVPGITLGDIEEYVGEAVRKRSTWATTTGAAES
jgi:CDP-glucose 4,6-dehydratase